MKQTLYGLLAVMALIVGVIMMLLDKHDAAILLFVFAMISRTEMIYWEWKNERDSK